MCEGERQWKTIFSFLFLSHLFSSLFFSPLQKIVWVANSAMIYLSISDKFIKLNCYIHNHFVWFFPPKVLVSLRVVSRL